MTENYTIRLNEDAAWEMRQFHFHDALKSCCRSPTAGISGWTTAVMSYARAR